MDVPDEDRANTGDLHLLLVEDYREEDQEREDEQIFALQDMLRRADELNKHRICERKQGLVYPALCLGLQEATAMQNKVTKRKVSLDSLFNLGLLFWYMWS